MTQKNRDIILGPLQAEDRRLGESMAWMHRLMSRLRAEDGCPWDRKQNLKSLRSYLVEECYELLETLDSGQIADHREELGDFLFQAFFQAQIRREQGAFSLADAVDGIVQKLIRRHPHVFADEKVNSAEDVKQRWDSIKRQEKPQRALLDGVPKNLPALFQSQRLGEKAAKVGFDWPNIDGVYAKVNEELAELKQALDDGDMQAAEDELGDVFFSLSQYARHLGLNSEEALRGSNQRFRTRLQHVEQSLKSAAKDWQDCTPDALESLWSEAKEDER